ncbi:hypothetical protein RAS2_08750 [Phycisphaerae bacterium RAS2]|nr:hypothetical protein RAS2_08750 [Phycisphaerae bacterium RAS2]
MTRNDRNAANVPVPAWLGWKRNIFYAALAAIVSAVFIYQLTRPESLLGGMLGWELERIDDASREGAAAPPGSITWAGLFAQLERKMPSLPDARPRAGTAQLIYAVDAVQRGKLSATDAVARLAPAEDAATFNLVARLAYAWLRDRAEANADPSPSPTASPSGNSPPPPSTSSASPPSSTPLARYDSISRILDVQPPATTATLYNDTLHDAWRDVLKTAIRRQDVIASCVRNYRHFDIREHYAALPTIHATFTALARELHTAGHLAQAETIRQWLDRAYMGLIDNERDYATRLLAAELLTDVRAADFYTAAPHHHRPSKLRDEFHARATVIDLVDLYKAPIGSNAATSNRLYWFVTCIELAAVAAGFLAVILCRCLMAMFRIRPFPSSAGLSRTEVHGGPDAIQWWILILVPFIIYYCIPQSPFLLKQIGSSEGFVVRLGFEVAFSAVFVVAAASWLSGARSGLSIATYTAIISSILFVLSLEPDRRLWPVLRTLDFGFGVAPVVGSLLLLVVITCTVLTTATRRVTFAVAARAWLVGACLTFAAYRQQHAFDREFQETLANSIAVKNLRGLGAANPMNGDVQPQQFP